MAPKEGPGSTSSANQRDDKAELWIYVLAMLVVLAIAESLLGNRQMAAAE
jgi:hypothetical protein